MTALLHTFVGGTAGRWGVERMQVIAGQALPAVPRVSIFEGNQAATLESSIWLLRGVTSYERYLHKMERSALVVQQVELGRLVATSAALIPIKKSTAWWELAQDELIRLESCSMTVHGKLRPKPWIGRSVSFSLKIPFLSREKLGIMSGIPQRLTLPVSPGR